MLERVGFSSNPVSSEAKREIMKKIIREVSEEQIIELIGEKAYSENRQLIRSRVIRNSGKYLPFLKTKHFRADGEQAEMSVVLKLSVKSLRALLLQNGMLYGSQGLPTIVQFLQFENRLDSKWVDA